ncbi:MAG: GDSL-type esterase/lipase family protein [Niabella sp.]
MNYKRGIYGLMILLLLYATCISYGQPLTQREKWEQKLQAFEKKDSLYPPATNNILFVGSSTIENWKTLEKDFAGYHVLNRGVSGTKMADLYAFRKRLIQPYNAKKIFIYEGDNDIALGWDADSICNVFKNLFQYIREEKPAAHIYVISIKPSPSREKYKENLLRTNALLKAFTAQQANATYIDVYTPMLEEGLVVPSYYRPDKLHLTEDGYKIWRSVIGLYIQE